MKIVLSGVETNNKGAELMLYAIVQEIERRFPKSEVYIPAWYVKQGKDYVKTSLRLNYNPYSYYIGKYHLRGLFAKLHLNVSTLNRLTVVKDADWFLDGSGFLFTDQYKKLGGIFSYWDVILKSYYKSNTKIVFLPQGFGPAEKPATRKMFGVLDKYATAIIPREKVSLEYICNSGIIDMSKVKMFTDFTSLVEGVFPNNYEHLKNGICVIPNMRMIDRGAIPMEDYKSLLKEVILKAGASGHPIYLLNHEGKQDEEFAKMLSHELSGEIQVVTDLNALETKGLIASAYLVVSSRFHGVASALNSCVPCLATSWSHKYEELYHDYGLDGFLLSLDDADAVANSVQRLLNPQENHRIREQLAISSRNIKEQTREMWDYVWNLTSN